ncbi:Lachesin like protein [Argiope bruennichi]|uniref:Lachesin like protein n=1 Tax=Argiope bruennichi TaxID=94029 RepID=A0A8T0E2R8_ARGBR|nr:Lachesin like protein [Argiope bruennichi]
MHMTRKHVWFLVFLAAASAQLKADLEPEFVQSIPNVTAVLGGEAELPCTVENLGSYRVAWIRVESQTILTIHKNIISRNYRITLNHKDHRHYNLHITNVQEQDRGSYMCQINTVPMKKQIGYLDVVVPPQFNQTDRSTEVLAREGTNVTLSCAVTGHPQPTVTWQREDGQAFTAGPAHNKVKKNSYEGEDLVISKVSRLHMGTYICTAENGVPPSMSRRTQLYVHFPPMLWIPNQLIGGSVGNSVTLECLVEAFPKSLNYWTRHDGQLLISGDRHTVTVQENTYKMHMTLTVRRLTKTDFGTYTCLARNSLGSTEGTIRVYETINPHSTSTAKTDYVEEKGLESWMFLEQKRGKIFQINPLNMKASTPRYQAQQCRNRQSSTNPHAIGLVRSIPSMKGLLCVYRTAQ